MSEMNEIRRRINQAIARGDEKEAAFARAEFWQTKAESIQRENEELKRYVNEAERLFRMYGLSSPPRKGHEWPNTGGMGDE